jgi:hypothetical protein
MAANDLARLVVKLEAQTAQYDASLKRANAQLRSFSGATGKILKGVEGQFASLAKRVIGLGGAFAVFRAASNSVKFGDDLAKAAQKSGIAANAFTELAHAAKLSDIDLGALSVGLKKMQVTLSEAGSGSKSAQQTLTALGLTFARLKDLKPDQQFELLADRIAQLQSPADRTRAAVELFGRAGADLLPLFEQGAAGIRAFRQEAIEAGKSFSEADLAKFQEVDIAFKRLNSSIETLSNTLVLRFGPALSEMADKLSVAFGGGSKLQELEVRIRDLQDIASQNVPIYFNFGYIAGAPIIMGPEEISKWLKKLTAEKEALANAGKSNQGSPSRASLISKPPGFVTPPATPKKLSDSQLAELEKFKNQSTQIANDIAGAFSSIAPAMVVNDAEIAAYFAKINEESGAASRRVMELGEAYKDTSDEISLFADQAARNMQSAFADFLFDPFEEGLDGMLKGFVDVLRRMVAEALAANIFSFMGGTEGIGGFFAGLFGIPGKAAGGPVSGGQPYVVGEKGPELFVPGTSGNIIPNGGLGPSVKISNVYHIDSRTDAAAIRQYVDRATAESARMTVDVLRDQRSRGRAL